MAVMSPIAMWVDERARTPEKFVAARKVGNGLNGKREKIKVEAEKIEVEVEVEELKLELKPRMKDGVELKAEVGAYREKMEEM